VQALARAACDGMFGPDAPAAIAALSGLGDWAAQVVALHALGEPDAFPSTDAVLRRMASGTGAALTASELEERAESWRPWRAYAAMHLWSAAADAAPARRVHRARGAEEIATAAP
jgi:AraC family transcriptional regulator of adaptative response / DNA-3-methyladenine glycosylase II